MKIKEKINNHKKNYGKKRKKNISKMNSNINTLITMI